MSKPLKPVLVEERFFPFECSVSYGVEEDYKALHWHHEMEICYIKQGTGKYLINGIDYSFSDGDIFLISNDEMHLCYDDKNLIMQVIMFDPSFVQNGVINSFDYEYLRPFFDTSECFCNKLDSHNPITTQLAKLLSEMENEYTEMYHGYELMIKVLLLKFLTLIIRNCFSNVKRSHKNIIDSKKVEEIKEIITYIDHHYAENINLQFLSEYFNISKSYLCSIFKALTGSSPIAFLIKKRIMVSKTLLLKTDENILKISEECGFGSLSNFNHQFKTFVGDSPSDYRKSHL